MIRRLCSGVTSAVLALLFTASLDAPAKAELLSVEIINPTTYEGPPLPGFPRRQYVQYSIERGSSSTPNNPATDRFNYVVDVVSDDPDLYITTVNALSNWIFNEDGAGGGFFRFYLVGAGSPIKIDRGFRYFLPFQSGTYVANGQEYSWDLVGGWSVRGEMFENNNSFIRVYRYATGTGPVPEPATWAMMILGFGMLGLAARHRAGVRLGAGI